MKNFRHEGKVLTVTAPYTLTSGQGCLVGDIFGVSTGAYSSGDTGAEIAVKGVFAIAKDTSVFAQGDKVYWDNSAKAVTSTASNNKLIGLAEVAALTDDATVDVWLVRSVGGLNS